MEERITMEYWTKMELKMSVVICLLFLLDMASAQMYPQPSDELPVLRLTENGDPRLDPNATDSSPNFLKSLLGGDFVPRYMSVSRPLESILQPNGSLDYSTFGVSKDIRGIRFAKYPGKFGGKHRRKFRKNVRQFLASFTYCPVKYQWKDMGLRFFPRWLREGACPTQGSCSIPPSNSCHPAKSINLRLLRWHCRNYDARLFCRWVSVWYPVVTACECKCPNSKRST